VFNLLLIAAAGFLATKLSLATATSFIDFGAFLAFTIVNICVIAAWVRFRHQDARMSVFGYVVLPALGALVDVYLLTKLDENAVLLGLAWLAVGVAYLAFLTRGFRQAPPELALEEVTDRTPSPSL
jgi:amino acid transporter